MLIHAVMHGGCTNTESVLKVDWVKNHWSHWGIEPVSVLHLAFQSDVLPAEPLLFYRLTVVDCSDNAIFRKHTQLVELNQRVMDALQMYHTLMRENPAYSFKAPAPGTAGPAPYSSLPPSMMGAPPSQMGQVCVSF